MLGHRQDEGALMRLEAFEEGVELVGHEWAVVTASIAGNRDRQSRVAYVTSPHAVVRVQS